MTEKRLSFDRRVVTAPDVLFRTIGDEAVLLNLRTEMYLGLDPVGTRVWSVLHESPSIEAGYEAHLAKPVPAATVVPLIAGLLGQGHESHSDRRR